MVLWLLAWTPEPARAVPYVPGLYPRAAARQPGKELRWERIRCDNAQSIIRLFVDDDLDTLPTTLADLGVPLELPVESVREAILVLLGEGDRTASADVERIAAEKPLELRIDWDRLQTLASLAARD